MANNDDNQSQQQFNLDIGKSLGDLNPGKVEQYLDGVQFPCDKGELLNKVKGNGASGEIVSLLENLPKQNFDGKEDVLSAMREVV